MAIVLNAKLILTRLPGNMVRIDVDYEALFSQFERRLAGLGLFFHDRIIVLGVDASASIADSILTAFPDESIGIADGEGELTIPCHRSMIVSRRTLDEDFLPNVLPDFNADEIRCWIRIIPSNFPHNSHLVRQETFTNQVVLRLAGNSDAGEVVPSD
jgi:hypothetical protein